MEILTNETKDCCPKCGSNCFMTERRPDGDSICSQCKYKGPSKEFTKPATTFLKQEEAMLISRFLINLDKASSDKLDGLINEIFEDYLKTNQITYPKDSTQYRIAKRFFWLGFVINRKMKEALKLESGL